MNRPFTENSFQQFLRDGQLMGSRSRGTGKIYVPPRPIDPESYEEDMEWVALSGQGTLAAYTAVYIAPSAMIAAGYDRNKPYCTGIVQLAEGPYISAQILGVDPRNPAQIEIGTPLTLTIIERGEGEQKRAFLAFTSQIQP